MSSFWIHSSTRAKTPGFGATAIKVLMRSTGTNLTPLESLLKEMDFRIRSSSRARSLGLEFRTSNTFTRCLAKASLSNIATSSIRRRILRRLSSTRSRFALG